MDDYLQLSGLQHYAFCPRQWALIHIEQQWAENLLTVKGMLMHDRVHQQGTERRGDKIIARGLRIVSHNLQISGACDAVEFDADPQGVLLLEYGGTYRVTPVEYKRGQPKEHDADELQLCAQAICLEEMLCCDIPAGYLYYGENRRRAEVLFSPQLRGRVRDLTEQMHVLLRRGYTPKVKPTPRCKACSLADICMPAMQAGKPGSARDYIDRMLFGEGES